MDVAAIVLLPMTVLKHMYYFVVTRGLKASFIDSVFNC